MEYLSAAEYFIGIRNNENYDHVASAVYALLMQYEPRAEATILDLHERINAEDFSAAECVRCLYAIRDGAW